MVPWFDTHLGYTYDPDVQGLPADWVMDLVNIDFQTTAAAAAAAGPQDCLAQDAAPASTSGSGNDKGSGSSGGSCGGGEGVVHKTMTNMDELQAAADLFQQQWQQQQGEKQKEEGEGWQAGQVGQVPWGGKDVCTGTVRDNKDAGTVAAEGSNAGALALERSLTTTTELGTVDPAQPQCSWWQELRWAGAEHAWGGGLGGDSSSTCCTCFLSLVMLQRPGRRPRPNRVNPRRIITVPHLLPFFGIK
jgi:hypothetical protein